MFTLDEPEGSRVISRVREISGIICKPPVEVVTDTTEYTRIHRGQVVRLERRDFFIRGNMYEPRFAMQDQPKFWVKRGYDLDNGRMVILKLGFHEEFITEFGRLRIPCFRSPAKEAQVLRLVKGDSRFMQGETLFDDRDNQVRVIDFINGKTLYGEIFDMTIDHEEYYHTLLPSILLKVARCCDAIRMLHEHGLYHGDIRNDHMVIDEETGDYRWIDFDLCQDYAPYDVWRLGNVMQFVIGKGLNPLYRIRRDSLFPAEVIASLLPSDSGAVYNYRLMNLKKIYPYISDRLNAILMRFSTGCNDPYREVKDLVHDLREAIPDLPAGNSGPSAD